LEEKHGSGCDEDIHRSTLTHCSKIFVHYMGKDPHEGLMILQSLVSLHELIGTIEPPSENWRAQARFHLDSLTKPVGSLGVLEDLAAQLVAIRRDEFALPLRKSVYVFAADHGISAEGVSAYPREVTRQMVLNFLDGGAAINVLARLHHADLFVVDVGVDADFRARSGLLDYKVARGTRNMLHEEAMSDEQLLRAFSVGIHLAANAAAMGVTAIAVGEMGIGNTTSASAITCALTGAGADLATGRGTGVVGHTRDRKVATVEAIIKRHFDGSLGAVSPLVILRRVGGLEIAAMVGMILGAVRHQLVLVIDGFISTAAAALAVALAPNAREFLVAGHKSLEPGHQLLLDYLGLRPLLTLEMRLGEGTGAVLAMPIIESAMSLYREMATFSSAGVSGASV
jgi:nicotinate-nucleotide--dimethylbenzimidazole phosphoribosyltransferase